MRTSPDPLTPSDLRQWEDEGWLLLRGAVPADVIQRLRDLFAGVVDGIVDDLVDSGVVENRRSALPFETRLALVA
ncbi:hypothetical protein HN937_20590, partial [Candidatus Poribacteria bacterium]|nr:hypothetical protein [Candidatus Poribacteria bacterium]